MYDFKNKVVNIRQNNNYLLTKTLSMFEWDGLPETIPSKELEKLLQNNGYAYITKVNGELYAFNGCLGGEVDVYGNPTTIIISNVALNFNKTLNIAEDGVLISSDDMKMGLLPLFNKHNSMLVENDINMVLHGYNSRLQNFISAGDDKTRASAEQFLEKIVRGELGIIGENALFEGVKTHSSGANNSNSITTLTEFHQYIKASLFNELGLNSNFNMKRERLTEGEVEAVEDILYPFVDNMMKNRLLAIKEINAKYGTSILIDYGSVWHMKNKELNNDVVEENDWGLEWDSTETDEPSALESSDESSLESLDESSNESETDELDALEAEETEETEGEPEPEETEDEPATEDEPETEEPEDGIALEDIEFILEDDEIDLEYREILEKLKNYKKGVK